MRNNEAVWPCYVHRTESPDGTVYTTIIENDDDKPREIRIQVGKTGGTIRAWSEALAAAITSALQAGVPLHKIIPGISGITTDRVSRFGDGIIIRSGPEAVAYSLIKYRQEKANESRTNDGDDWQSPMEFGDLSESK